MNINGNKKNKIYNPVVLQQILETKRIRKENRNAITIAFFQSLKKKPLQPLLTVPSLPKYNIKDVTLPTYRHRPKLATA